ncbi:MAG: TonB-dependent receptor [Hyphomicrobiaceae bacterium]|nr:TonB-dependent receptor [Hyphomicrobiaceae bacterium]
MAGGTAIITSAELEGRANVTIGDTLNIVPGVVVQNFFGGNDQPRIQIRGSGLQQNPVERGILVLQDGLPLNRADGSYIVGLADPRQAQFTEIYRGYTANRLGATVLGGAINFTSPNGTSSPGTASGFEGGSFGQITTSGQAGASKDDIDVFGQVSHSKRDGFRVYNDSERLNVNLNSGAKLNEHISTRVYLGYTDIDFDVAGPLTRTALEQNPKQIYAGPTVTPPPPALITTNPGPNVVRDRPHREADQFGVGSRTSVSFGAHLIDTGFGYAYTDDSFRFPIGGGIRDTDGGDFTTVVRYSYAPNPSRTLPLFEATALYVNGSADRENYLNIAGTQGARFGDNELDATTLSLYAGAHIPIVTDVTLSPTISYSHATRDNKDRFGLGTRPVAGFDPITGALQTAFALPQNTSYSRSYSGWSPSLGLTFDVAPESTVFAAVSRSFEPPTHDDLLATINGSPFFSPGAPAGGTPRVAFATPNLDAQTATTIEGGWRGQSDGLSWDAVTYYSWVENELLNLRDSSGVSLGAVNADKTTHFGVELGLSKQISKRLSGRVAYTYQNFRFDNDPVHGDNRLAGAPRHNVVAALRYFMTRDWYVEGEVYWRPDKTPVDNANTLFNEEWSVFNFRTLHQINETISLYGEVRNVFDKVYASSTLITDVAQPDQAAFLPGDGRAFNIGLRVRM